MISLAERQYVVKDVILYRQSGKPVKCISRATLPQPTPRRLEDRPVIINGSKAVTL
jgi:hypothetical protein